jgi:hypothetical protein
LGDPESDDPPRPDPVTDDDGDAHRAPVEQALEVFVYAPVGLLLEAHRLWPEVVERGRREVGNSRDWFERRLRNVVGEAEAALRGLGLAPDRSAAPAPRAQRPTSTERRGDGDPVKPTLVVAPEPRAEPRDDGGPALDPETLAIPGYDSLSASQVVPRLAGLAPEELELVREYELAGRGRRTILSRIAQLQDPT